MQQFRPETITDEAGRRVRVERRRLAPKPDAAVSRVAIRADALDRLDDLAGRVRRLMPSRTDPEAFHVERSEIAAGLQAVYRLVEKLRD